MTETTWSLLITTGLPILAPLVTELLGKFKSYGPRENLNKELDILSALAPSSDAAKILSKKIEADVEDLAYRDTVEQDNRRLINRYVLTASFAWLSFLSSNWLSDDPAILEIAGALGVWLITIFFAVSLFIATVGRIAGEIRHLSFRFQMFKQERKLKEIDKHIHKSATSMNELAQKAGSLEKSFELEVKKLESSVNKNYKERYLKLSKKERLKTAYNSTMGALVFGRDPQALATNLDNLFDQAGKEQALQAIEDYKVWSSSNKHPPKRE